MTYQPRIRTKSYHPPVEGKINGVLYWISRRWIVVFIVSMGLYVGLPFLAPLFMKSGWTGFGKAIYALYATQCHQLPQRSFFLFGAKFMYSLREIQSVWQDSPNLLILRQFYGNPEMGWKVAWSDRMVSMYTSVLIIGMAWWLMRKRVRPLPVWGLLLLLAPMVVDGSTHLISDLAGLGQGFRDSNIWLATLTGKAFGDEFYSGDAWGSFNSWMRLVTGVLFGIGVVGYGFPHLNRWFDEIAEDLLKKL